MDAQSISLSAVEKHIPLWKDFYLLTKPSITFLVIITAIPSLFLSLESWPSFSLFFSLIIGTGLASSSAAVFNQLIEASIDSEMNRTKRRSLPTGRMSQSTAISFGAILGFLGFGVLYFGTQALAAWIALFGHAFYVLIYTVYLKPRTPQNIVIGGASGAVGPLIGWAAGTGYLSVEAWLLFLWIFLWTPPHFWALAIKYKDDYKKANIPMYPVIYGIEATYKQIQIYSFSLILLSMVIYLCHIGSVFFFLFHFSLSAYFFFLSKRIAKTNNLKDVMKFFVFSCLYAFLIFGTLTLDVIFQKI